MAQLIPWTYEDQDNWVETFPECGGYEQSPINIETAAAKPSQSRLQLFNYDNSYSTFTIFNNGHYIEFNSTGNTQTISVDDQKQIPLVGMDLRWGLNDGVGSEHRFDGHQFDAEWMFIHSGQNEAHEESVSIMSVLFHVTPENNRKIQPFIDIISNYDTSGQSGPAAINQSVNLGSLLPERTSPVPVYSYFGSQSEPPCIEGIMYLIVGTVNTIGEEQIKVLRNLLDIEGNQIGDNFRDIQNPFGRKVTLMKLY